MSSACSVASIAFERERGATEAVVRMDVVGYVRVSLDCGVDDLLPRRDQVDAIERWAAESRHRLVATFTDEGATASTDLSTRLALSDALHALRTGAARALVVARLERLAPSIVLQEHLLADIERMGCTLVSARRDEAVELTEAARDQERLLIRGVVRAAPAFHSAMRDLWVRHRIRRSPRADDTEEAAMARIEELAEQGLGARAISARLSAEGFRPRLARAFDITGLARLIRSLKGRSARGDAV